MLTGKPIVVTNGSRLSFQVPKTGTKFTLWVKFVAVGERGSVMKGATIQVANHKGDPVLPDGVQFIDSFQQPFVPDGKHLAAKKDTNPCSFTDVDGENYDLFKVGLVDEGGGGSRHDNSDGGGTLYFHDPAAIPPELGGQGILKDDPNRNLENG